MKKLISIVGVCVSIVSAYAEEEQKSAWTPSVTLSTEVYSKYLDESGAVFYNKPVIQTDLCVSFENGLYLDLWNSTPTAFSEWNENFGSEQDMSLGWSGTLDTLGIGGWLGECDLDLSAVFWDEPNLGVFGAEDVFNVVAKIGRAIPYDSTGSNTVNVSFEFMQSWPLQGSSFEGGSLCVLEAGKTWSCWNDRLRAELALNVVHDSGRFGQDSGFVLGGRAGLEWVLSDRVSLLIPRVAWTTPITVNDDRELCAAVSGGISVSF